MTDRPITIISKPTDAVLNGRQRIDYAAFKESFVEWLQAMGKDPKHATGYANSTVRQTSTRIDKFYRWKWDHDGSRQQRREPLTFGGFLRSLLRSHLTRSSMHHEERDPAAHYS